MLLSSELLVKLAVVGVVWYFVEMPLSILKTTVAYTKAFSKKFSVVLLLRTVIRPWKNMRKAYPDKGLQIKKIFRAFSANMVARLVGGVIRLVTASIGIVVSIGIFLMGLAFFAIWIGAPVWIILIMWTI